MPASSKSQVQLEECLQTHMAEIKECQQSFSQLVRSRTGKAPVDADFQYEASSEGCFAQVVFVKRAGTDQLDHLVCTFPEEQGVTLSEMEALLGEFDSYPPSPSGVFTSMALLDASRFQIPITVILENTAPIKAETHFSRLTIRIDL